MQFAADINLGRCCDDLPVCWWQCETVYNRRSPAHSQLQPETVQKYVQGWLFRSPLLSAAVLSVLLSVTSCMLCCGDCGMLCCAVPCRRVRITSPSDLLHYGIATHYIPQEQLQVCVGGAAARAWSLTQPAPLQLLSLVSARCFCSSTLRLVRSLNNPLPRS